MNDQPAERNFKTIGIYSLETASEIESYNILALDVAQLHALLLLLLLLLFVVATVVVVVEVFSLELSLLLLSVEPYVALLLRFPFSEKHI